MHYEFQWQYQTYQSYTGVQSEIVRHPYLCLQYPTHILYQMQCIPKKVKVPVYTAESKGRFISNGHHL